MNRTLHTSLLVIMPLVLSGITACSNAQTSSSGTVSKLNSAAPSSKHKADTISMMIDGQAVQIVKSDSGAGGEPVSMTIGGHKVAIAKYEVRDSLPDNMKGANVSTAIVNGKKVTVYNSSSCTQANDSLKKVKASAR